MSHGDWKEIVKGSNTVPQPAGHTVVTWYQRNQPPTDVILYALAHALGGTLKLEDLQDDPGEV